VSSAYVEDTVGDLMNVIILKHTQNTDTILDDGGLNEVSAEEIRDFIDNLPSVPSAFIDLTDTPVNYTGHAGKVVSVKATEDGLEFDDIPTPSSILGTDNEWTKRQVINVVPLTGTSITIDTSQSCNYKLSLTGDTTFNIPTNLKEGHWFGVDIVQDLVTARTVTFNSYFKFPKGANKQMPSTLGALVKLSCSVCDGHIKASLIEFE
jgi:hypothetical protein